MRGRGVDRSSHKEGRRLAIGNDRRKEEEGRRRREGKEDESKVRELDRAE